MRNLALTRCSRAFRCPTAALAAGPAAILLALGGCATGLATQDQPVSSAALIASDGRQIGTVSVFPQPTAVLLRVNAAGLPPGQHGVHLHAAGRCDRPSFESAGPHWNPTGAQHGHRNPQGPHRGDLGNVGVGADGRLVAGLLVPGADFWSGVRDADGTSFMIHATADDERTDPSGNSGARIACAVL
jgi:superoxide dismutase, Cu-Zn family